jgi:hypothetical protein
MSPANPKAGGRYRHGIVVILEHQLTIDYGL